MVAEKVTVAAGRTADQAAVGAWSRPMIRVPDLPPDVGVLLTDAAVKARLIDLEL
jgi:hypothetical protein